MKLHSTISCHLLHDFVPPGPSPLSVSFCFLLQELIGGPYTVTAMDKVDSFPEIDDLRLPDSLSVQRVDTR